MPGGPALPTAPPSPLLPRGPGGPGGQPQGGPPPVSRPRPGPRVEISSVLRVVAASACSWLASRSDPVHHQLWGHYHHHHYYHLFIIIVIIIIILSDPVHSGDRAVVSSLLLLSLSSSSSSSRSEPVHYQLWQWKTENSSLRKVHFGLKNLRAFALKTPGRTSLQFTVYSKKMQLQISWL